MIKLTKKQYEALRRFFETPSRYFLIVGGRGAGKTFLGSFITYLIAKHMPASILLAREYQKDVENTMLEALKKWLTPQEREFVAKHTKYHNKYFDFPSGARIYFISANKKEEHFQSVRSYEYNFVWIDEASRIEFEAFQEIDFQVRLKYPDFRKILLTSNPVDETHWLYEFFEKEKRGEYMRFSSWDNIENLPPDYIEMLKRLPPALQEIMVEGKWGEYKESKLYHISDKNFIPHEIVLRDYPPFEYSSYGRIYASCDVGVENNAFVFALRTFSDNFIIFQEFYFKDKAPTLALEEVEKQMYNLYRINIRKVKWCGDVSIRQSDYSGKKIFEYFPFPIISAKVPLNASIEKENICLTKERNGKPILMISSNCPLTKKSFFEAYFTEQDKILKEDPYQHIKDAVRYLVWHFISLDSKTSIQFLELKPSIHKVFKKLKPAQP
jgi:PBSX family phage terminase large subunit